MKGIITCCINAGARNNTLHGRGSGQARLESDTNSENDKEIMKVAIGFVH